MPLLLVACARGAAALWLDGPASRLAAGGAASAFAIASVAALVLRPRRRGPLLAFALVAAVVGWWLAIPARNDRDWIADVARPSRAQIDGSQITIENVRSFESRSDTDFTERWETRHCDLDDLIRVDHFLSFWGPTLISHTIVAWEFSNAPRLAISIETREEKGEENSSVLGFFRHCEPYYVVAGEPASYNAATSRCPTTIRHHVQDVGPANPWDWRILANGHLDEPLYERGSIDTSLSFAALRARSDVTGNAKAADADPSYSQRIRDAVPGF